MTQTGRENGVAVLEPARKPSGRLREAGGAILELARALEEALAEPSVRAIIIADDGKLLSLDADIGALDQGVETYAAYRALLARIEAAAKPVVIAIDSPTPGDGLELALAGHYRIATSISKFGLPHVKRGLLPAAGGTQRLPRLVGAERAIRIMLSGESVSADEALTIGLIDATTSLDPVQAALNFLARTDGLPPPRPTGDLPPPADVDLCVKDARSKLKARSLNQAPRRILDCVETLAGDSLANGFAREAECLSELLSSEASLGLRHAMFGQRAVAYIPGGAPPTPLRIASVAVVGGGLMGTGIALSLLGADLLVTIVEPRPEARQRAQANIFEAIARDVSKGRLSSEAAKARTERLRVSDAMESAADADLVIEAVFEQMDVKAEVFRALDSIAKPTAILASNTSTLDLNAIAAFTRRPDRVVGLHFFSPANVMRLLEIVRGARTSPTVLATAMSFAHAIGKVGVVAGVCDGFIGNRIFEEYLRQAYFLAEEGASPQQIDLALEAWGMAMGPFRTMDLAGQDIGWSIRKRRAIEQPERPYSGFPDRICELGRLGQKTGKGVYLYPDGRTATPDPEIDALLRDYCAEKGIDRRPIANEEIVERCLLAMILEGARIVEEGIAYRPVDVDVVYLNGYGFPAERGGPMFFADRLGLPLVLDKVRSLAKGRNGWVWSAPKLLVDLAARGQRFESLNS